MSETRPTSSEYLAKTVARARSRGLAEVAASLRDQLRSVIASDGTLEFLVRRTDETRPERADLSFRAAGFGDGRAYQRDIGTDSAATFRARLSDETSCYLVLADHRIAHASWVTTKAAWTAELGRLVTPPSGAAYVYESFTAPELRGRGIYPFALRCICAELAGAEISDAWIGVETTNVPSGRAITKAGFEPAFSVAYRKAWSRVEIGPLRGPRSQEAAALLGMSLEV